MADNTITNIPEEDLDTSSDEDFVDEPSGSDASASDEDVEVADTTKISAAKRTSKKRKRNAESEPDSGDEAVKEEFRKARKRKSKGKNKGEDEFVFSDEEGGAGGFIKTRRQRLEDQGKERKPLRGIEGATADVDAIWARLSAVPANHALGSVLTEEQQRQDEDKENEVLRAPVEEEEFITIKRTYDFAGEVKTEERRVPKHSAEAKLYMQSKSAEETSKQAGNDAEAGEDGKPTVRRPLRRASRFDPNPLGEVRGLPERLQLRYPRTTNEDGEPLENVSQLRTFKKQPAGAGAKAKVKPADKINTVDKSRMDWAGFVDQEGLAEELDEYGKAKANYVDRSRFLARMEARRDDDMRAARLKQQQQTQ